MRVITGLARGKKLLTLEGNDVRPTTDRVKEAIFSMIQFQIEGRTFLDLFAGSGQMGIEALSRGAKQAVFVDSDKNAIDVIKNNLRDTSLSDKAKVLQMDSIAYLKQKNQDFDLIYLDPPYRKGLLLQALNLVCESSPDTKIIICEHPIEEDLPDEIGDFFKKKTSKYGKILVSSYLKKGSE